MRIIAIITAAAIALASSSAFAATQCRDSHGKFIKCAPVAQTCRDAKGHFAKCGTPGAKPAGVKTMKPTTH